METRLYREYVTEQLRLIPEGKSFRNSYSDMLSTAIRHDTRTGDEIAAEVIRRAGLTWEGGVNIGS